VLGVGIITPVLEWLRFTGLLLVIYVGLRLLATAVERGPRAFDRARRRRRARRAARAPETPVAAEDALTFSLTLLVRVDGSTGFLAPSVQLRGERLPQPARVRLELVDDEGVSRLMVGRYLPPDALRTELPLPRFTPLPGRTVDDALRLAWDVVVEGPGGELARWRERPGLIGGLNEEAEIQMPDQALGTSDARQDELLQIVLGLRPPHPEHRPD